MSYSTLYQVIIYEAAASWKWKYVRLNFYSHAMHLDKYDPPKTPTDQHTQPLNPYLNPTTKKKHADYEKMLFDQSECRGRRLLGNFDRN